MKPSPTLIPALVFSTGLLMLATAAVGLMFASDGGEYALSLGWLAVFSVWYGVPATLIGAVWWMIAFMRRSYD